jgi:hypothetical protein
MINNSLNFSINSKPILIFVMLLLSTQVISGQFSLVNGDQNKGTVFTFSPHAREYNCVMHRNQYLGKKYSVGPGGSFVVIINRDTSGDCSGEPALFSIYTADQKKIAFKMHGNGGFVYVPIKASSGGYECEKSDCLKYNSYQRMYTFTTNFVAPKVEQKKQLKLGKMTGRWVEVCPPGISCKLTYTTSVTIGSNKSEVRSEEVTEAVSESLTLGFEADIFGVTTSMEGTIGREHSVAKTIAQEVGSMKENSNEQSREVDIDYVELDVASVWRWVMFADLIGGNGKKFEIETKIFGCSRTEQAPGYLPRSQEHIKSCITKRNDNTAVSTNQYQSQAPNQTIQFSVNPITQLSQSLPTNSGAACETEDQKYLFFQGQDYWIYDNNNGQSYGPVPSSSEGFPDYIDACVNGYNNKIYIFKGTQYWRYDISSWSVDAGYPKEISSGWSGLPNYITSAARVGNNRIKFFAGDSIYNWDMTTDTIIPGVGSMRNELSQLPNSTDASIYIHNKTLFFGAGNMYNPVTY